MTPFPFDRKTTLLVSIGLVLVGLLADVLLMLTAGRQRQVFEGDVLRTREPHDVVVTVAEGFVLQRDVAGASAL